MKQMVLMLVLTCFGSVGSFAFTPLYGIAIYYLYSMLRPQFLWEWSEVLGYSIRDVGWSYYVAMSTLIATFMWRTGLFAPTLAARTPWYGNLRFNRTHYLFLAFCTWICITYLTAHSQERAYPFFLEYVKIFVMFVCATLVLRTVRDLWLIYYIVLGSVLYISYEINFMYIVWKWLMLQQVGFCGLDNNGAALMIAMAVPMCFFAWEATRHWTRWGFLLVMPILLHAVLISYSRGAMLSLLPAAALIWYRSRNKETVSVVYAALAVCVFAMAGKEIQDRFFSIAEADVDASAQSRWVTWKIAVQMANERPLFGFGIRNSNLFTFDYGADMEGRSIHSQYLQTAADSGWIACFLYIGLLVSVFLGLWETRRLLRPWNDPETLRVKSLASGLECSLVVFAVGAIFLSLEHFEMPYILMLLAVQLQAIARAVTARAAAVRAAYAHAQVVLPPASGPRPQPAV